MARWFRSHANKLDNPKVQRLSDALYRAWDSLLCVTCRYDGVLPPIADTAFLLRKSEDAAQRLIDALIERGLFVKTERGVEPHEWNEWQYKSDVSTPRVKQFRERQRNVSSNVSETPSESEADTETERTPAKAGESAPPKPSKSGTRIPPNWRPNDAGRAYASERGLDPDSTADAFIDWWSAENGPKATKRDWDAAFRTWCRRDSGNPHGPLAKAAARPVRATRGGDAFFERLADIRARSLDDEQVRK